jgi:hypothetical protein
MRRAVQHRLDLRAERRLWIVVVDVRQPEQRRRLRHQVERRLPADDQHPILRRQAAAHEVEDIGGRPYNAAAAQTHHRRPPENQRRASDQRDQPAVPAAAAARPRHSDPRQQRE